MLRQNYERCRTFRWSTLPSSSTEWSRLILREIRDLRQDFAGLRRDFNRLEKNNFARLMNSKVTSDNTQLEAFYGQDNAVIPKFPPTNADIRGLDSVAINNLLTALELPTDGLLERRRNIFRQHIGLTVL
ncbi:hypothetical protein FPQ18DRAFT_356830 [Pyronema domesticum]|uniref:Uncharacterized protein n=1 Tax=Pyronema omphalodes (strain CBS 100304) TaxID=1076935 RepID=U4LER0_PYROM|nr:hypothetical protein FPQ18DRAFT_356830 [Pyronema domesticum]CCX30037.1 Similar to hypothetical protein [Tuber melanosporum Mel28]; acc. no. XP_002839754 [Pyronema omphalodes CBS 100304]